MSQRSVLEIEIGKVVRRALHYFLYLDRAVLLGLLLSIVPFPPSTCIGVILDLLNLGLILTGALDRRAAGPVLIALAIGVLNLYAFVFLLGLFRPDLVMLWKRAARFLESVVTPLLPAGSQIRHI